MFIIDRFEGDWVVVEFGRKTFNLPKFLFPAGAKEGDVIEIEVSIDQKTTAFRKKSVNELADILFED